LSGPTATAVAMLPTLFLGVSGFVGPPYICPWPQSSSTFLFADMHDGDQKNVTFGEGHFITLSQDGPVPWDLTAKFDIFSCTATIDFSKSKKPAKPPVPLKATLKQTRVDTYLFEFTDPSGTLNPDKTYPLNLWTTEKEAPAKAPCIGFPDMPFQDMHDGDVKTVSLQNNILTMGQSGVWNLSTPLNPKTCKATVDFSKSSKPAKPPVPLVVSVTSTHDDVDGSIIMTYTDPSVTISPSPTFPLNIWESVSGRSAP